MYPYINLESFALNLCAVLLISFCCWIWFQNVLLHSSLNPNVFSKFFLILSSSPTILSLIEKESFSSKILSDIMIKFLKLSQTPPLRLGFSTIDSNRCNLRVCISIIVFFGCFLFFCYRNLLKIKQKSRFSIEILFSFHSTK